MEAKQKRTKVIVSVLVLPVLGLLALCGPAWAVEGMISYWNFDEGIGTMAYDCFGDSHGTIYGAQWITGQVDGALSFDGVEDYVQLPVGAADLGLEYATQSFSIEMWLKTTQSEERYLFDNYRYTLGNISFRIDAGKIEWHIGKYRIGNYILFRSEASVNDGLWHHVACIWDDAGEATIFVDGNYSGSSTNPNLVGSLESGYPFLIGTRIERSGLPEKFFRGTIDEVAIYRRALTAGEIQVHYEYGLSGYAYPGPEVMIRVGIAEKLEALERINAALEKEWAAYEALEEFLESGEYRDLRYGDIVTAKQKIHSAIQHQEQSIDALKKSIEKLEDALAALGIELVVDEIGQE